MWFNRGIGNLNLKPGEVAGIMALASVKSEKNTFVGGFDTSFSPLAMYKSTTFRDTMNQNSSVWPNNFGGTDASQGYLDATRNNRVVDVFVSLTDNMTWAGGRNHPTQALEEYRRKVNKNAKAVYVTIDPGYSDRITLVDPSDPRSTDLAGFSADSVRYISMFATGDLDVSVVDS
jgi:60 kDa SS-A/Ro ribonucleoprotein